jgi:hypothetical protein
MSNGQWGGSIIPLLIAPRQEKIGQNESEFPLTMVNPDKFNTLANQGKNSRPSPVCGVFMFVKTNEPLGLPL